MISEKKYYRIKHKVTGLYLTSLDYDRRTREWIPAFHKTCIHAGTHRIRYIIERMIQSNCSSVLDECEIEAYKIIEEPLACKPLSFHRRIVEQNIIVQKLKQD